MKRPAPYSPRAFLPEVIDLGDWDAIEPWFEAVERNLADVSNVQTFEAWQRQYDELSAAIAEERELLQIAMTCQTDDPEREKAYILFVEEILPKVQIRDISIMRRVASMEVLNDLPVERYKIYRRKIEAAVRCLRDENVPLVIREAKLRQKYQKICGAMTAEWDGKDQTLARIGTVMEETDRERRHQAFDAIVRRRHADRDALNDLFDELLAIRRKKAANADLAGYRDFIFLEYERFDYTAEDCEKFHTAVEKCFVPLMREIEEHQRNSLGVDRLRPWDLAVDPLGRPPLKPFQVADDLISGTAKIIRRLDPGLAGDFESLNESGMLDLENRKGKAPGGYQSTLSEARIPFIFMNAVGLHRDVMTLLHEAGHAFHAIASRGQFPAAYRHSPIEFCEVASMGMELLALDELDAFYNEQDHRRARHDQVKSIISVFPWIAMIDAFQHWLYSKPDHSRTERTEAWLDLWGRFGGLADWEGYEFARESAWQKQLHIFEVPFYYIEYGIAQIGALGLWLASKDDRAAVIESYRRALALGGARPLPELFAAAGLTFDLSEKSILPLAEMLGREYRNFRE